MGRPPALCTTGGGCLIGIPDRRPNGIRGLRWAIIRIFNLPHRRQSVVGQLKSDPVDYFGNYSGNMSYSGDDEKAQRPRDVSQLAKMMVDIAKGHSAATPHRRRT